MIIQTWFQQLDGPPVSIGRSTAPQATGALQVALWNAPCDEAQAARVRDALRPLIDHKTISLLSSLPGDRLHDQLQRAAKADVVLILVSPELLNQNDYEVLLQSTARVVPVLLRPALWESTPLSQRRPIPLGGRPIATWENSELAWASVLDDLHRLFVCSGPT